MAETKPSKNDLSIPTISTDANGWTIYDYGTYKQYRKRGVFTESLTANQWKFSANTTSLPVGLSTLGNNFLEGSASASDSAVTVAICNGTTISGINFSISNQYGGAINNFSLIYSLCITTLS